MAKSEHYHYNTFVGVSEGTEERRPTLEEAFEKAWENAKEHGFSPEGRLRLVDVEVYGSNPIDMYKVTLTDG